MRKYWPKLSNPRNFWSHEWTRHGNCYLDLIKNKYKSLMSNQAIYKSYFLKTVSKMKELKITFEKGKVATKAELAKIMKIPDNAFYAICGSDNELDEVRICFSITGTPGEEKLMKCPIIKDNTICKFPISIK